MLNISTSPRDGLVPSSYLSEAHFAHEMRAVFRRHWIFAGFKSALSQPNDFVTLSVGGLPVVVQNFAGELRAFLNVCAHRRATLQTQACGNRKLICPYHGWTYDASGAPAGIPDNVRSFQIHVEGAGPHSLKRYALETCGNFLFVRVASDGPDLKTFLGSQWAVLEHLSQLMAQPLASRKMPWKTNWKIGVESVLEIYHVAQVHPETFKKFTMARWDCEADGLHSTGHSDLSPEAKKWWKRVRGLLGLAQSDQVNEYNHYFIYPNLAIGVTNGTLMSVQTYDPVDASQCVLNYRLWVAGTGAAPAISLAQQQAILDSVVTFNDQVLDEDRVISEQCQQNMAHVDTPAVIGVCEGRIQVFHQALERDCSLKEFA